MKHSTPIYYLIISLCLISFLFSCKNKHDETEILVAMKHYDNLILHQKADSIALLYTTDGNLGDIAIGRDSIRKFLSSFNSVKVIEQSSTSDSIKIINDTAFQWGKYRQVDIFNGKDTMAVRGTFTTQWCLVKKDGWLIKKMITSSKM